MAVIAAVVLVVGVLTALNSHSPSSGSGGSSYGSQSGLTVNGQPITINFTRFTDPATDTSGNGCDASNTPGSTCQPSDDHFVTTEFQITNNGDSTISDSLPVTFIAFGSDHNTYTETDQTNGGDTLCNEGSLGAFSPNQSYNYCEGFVLPASVTVTSIQASADAATGSGTVSWHVSDDFAGWGSGGS